MTKTTCLLDRIPAAVLALVVLAATAQPPAPQRTDASRYREPDPIAFDDHAGFVSIFDGQTLKDRVGDSAIWRVENGVIVGESTREKPSDNSYISYHGIVAKDFDLKLEIKVENGGGTTSSIEARPDCPGAALVQATRPSISTG